MRRIMLSPIVLFLGAVLVSLPCFAGNPGDPALSKQRYDSIVTNLDTGGDLLIVANLDGYVKEIVESIISPFLSVTDSSPDSQAVIKSISKIPGFLEKNGFYAVQGLGMSLVPRTDGLNSMKCFIGRNSQASASPLWRGMIGSEPRALACAGFLPEDTVLVRSGTAELGQLWKLFRKGMDEIATPATSAGFNKALAGISTNAGVDLDKVFESLAGDGFFSVQLSRTATMELPMSPNAQALKVPQPSMLFCMAVKDRTLLTTIEKSLAMARMPVMATELESTTIKTVNLPLPLPFPVQPSYAVCSNFFLFGSTAKVVSDAVQSFKDKKGLTATPEYKAAFQGQPAVHNGVLYMSPRLMAVISELQTAALNQPGMGNDNMLGVKVMRELMKTQKDMQSAFVFQNLKTGILITGTTSSGGRELIGSALMAPAGMIAAIALPSFMKARTSARDNACINNLRMIDGAKEQWGLECSKAEGDEVDVKGILEYMKGNALPVCPQGGTYKINALGTDPECSIPGHKL